MYKFTGDSILVKTGLNLKHECERSVWTHSVIEWLVICNGITNINRSNN